MAEIATTLSQVIVLLEELNEKDKRRVLTALDTLFSENNVTPNP